MTDKLFPPIPPVSCLCAWYNQSGFSEVVVIAQTKGLLVGTLSSESCIILWSPVLEIFVSVHC